MSTYPVPPVLGPAVQANANPAPNQGQIHSSVPLPKFEIPSFSGELEDWEEYRDRFISIIINDTRLTDSDRMKYLVGSLDGSARRAIAHFRITDANFKDAWSTVCDKFQNLREMIASRFDLFHELPIVSAYSLKNLQSLQEITRSTPRSLVGLGRKVEGWNDLYVDCILRKLNKEARMLLTDKLPNDKDAITLEQVEEFIEHRIQVLQSGARASAASDKVNTFAKSERKPKSTRTHATVATQPHCLLCSNSHYLSRCNRFRGMSVEKRREFVKEKRCCWLCLSVGHGVQQCTSAYRCNECKNKHHILLHKGAKLPRQGASTETPSNPSISKPDTKVVSHTMTADSHTGTSVLLATAWVRLYNPDGRSTTVRALLDQGSEATLLTERVAQLLRLPRIQCSTKISGVGGINCLSQSVVRIGIGHRSSHKAQLFTEVFVIPTLTRLCPPRATRTHRWSHLENLTLADPEITSSHGLRRGPRNTPIAQKTALGWILSGHYESDSGCSNVVVHTTRLERVASELQKFWRIEELPDERFLTPVEQECETYFCNTVSRDRNGRYIVLLPFSSPAVGVLGDSRKSALKCLTSLERRLQNDPERAKAYTSFIHEYESLGHMTKVTSSVNGVSSGYYIPHHAVFRTIEGNTKIRVVFSASMKTLQGPSLNDQLHIGQRLQQDLSSIILKWRFFKYAMTADIAKMYRQILVDKRDIDFQRILWRDTPDDSVSEYQLLTVTYGMSCAPFLALRVMKQLAVDEGDNFPDAKEILQTGAYVDDCFFGADTIARASDKRDRLISLLKTGGFPLSKWSANTAVLLEGLQTADIKLQNKEFSECDAVHVLGLQWNPPKDTFFYSVTDTTIPVFTKRSILSTIAKLASARNHCGENFYPTLMDFKVPVGRTTSH